MPQIARFLAALLAALPVFSLASAQSPELQQFIQQAPKITTGEAVTHVMESSSLTNHGSPFHARLVIDQPGHPDSQFQGTVEIYWASPTRYRVTVTSRPFEQTRTVNGNAIEETNRGDFYPSWLRNYFLAVFELLPRAEEFSTDKTPVMLGANMSQSCVTRDDRPNGITDVMTWAQICFAGAEPRVKYTMDFTYFMEYGDYEAFGNKMIARTYTDYDKNNDKVIGKLTILEPLKPADEALLEVKHPTPADQQIVTHFVPTAISEPLLESAPKIKWPTVHQGKTEGTIILHILTDKTGQVREAYGHSSDNPALFDLAVEQAKKYKFKPLLLNGAAVQIETPLVLHFSTRLDGLQK